MTNKLTLTEQEELFAKDCKLINLKYEYNGYTGAERWAIITELSVKELWEKYPLVIERYSPFVHLSIAQGEVIDDANRNAVYLLLPVLQNFRSSARYRTLPCRPVPMELLTQTNTTALTAHFPLILILDELPGMLPV